MNRSTQKILADNARKLLDKHFEGKQSRFLAKTGFGTGTLTRILKAEQSVNLGSIVDFAALFKLEAWPLLVADFDPDDVPVFSRTSNAKAQEIAASALRQIAQSSKQ